MKSIGDGFTTEEQVEMVKIAFSAMSKEERHKLYREMDKEELELTLRILYPEQFPDGKHD